MKLERDLAFFDLEATGTDPQHDRIVSAAVVRLSAAGERMRWSTLVNPEMPIPREATAVHHITDDMAAKAPLFRAVAPEFLGKLEGADWGGFGVTRYDVPMLVNECRRVGVPLSMEGRRILDAQVIFHKKEPRNLTAALKLYCGRSLENAHSADADAEASLDVFLTQLERYKDLPSDFDGIARFCAPGDSNGVDPGGRFVWRHGEAAFNFGKYRTRSLREVLSSDRGYVEWAARTQDMGAAAEICREALQGVFPKKPDG